MLSILLITFLILLILGCPIAIGMCFASFSALLFGNTPVPLTVVPQRMFVTIDSFSMMAIPLFILAGELMNSAGITRRIVNFCSALVGHIRGGLAHVNILASSQSAKNILAEGAYEVKRCLEQHGFSTNWGNSDTMLIFLWR